MMFVEEKDNFTLNEAGICNCMSLELLFMTIILTHSAHPKVHSNIKRGGSQKFKSLTEVAKKKKILQFKIDIWCFRNKDSFRLKSLTKPTSTLGVQNSTLQILSTQYCYC